MVDATPQTHTRRLLVLLSLAVLLVTGNAAAQQQADTLFQPVVAKPAYAPGAGPVVFVNEAHHNSPCDTGLSVALPILRRIFSSIPSFPPGKKWRSNT